jgi:acyl-CoA reductase-like NAD-dependent aldehyde dehydrogenase
LYTIRVRLNEHTTTPSWLNPSVATVRMPTFGRDRDSRSAMTFDREYSVSPSKTGAGGNAAAVVLPDWSSEPDLDWAAQRIATYATYQGGQTCVSVQRVIADAAVYDRLADKLVASVEAQVTGDPADESVDVGPLIDEAAARRVESWVDEAARGRREPAH